MDIITLTRIQASQLACALNPPMPRPAFSSAPAPSLRSSSSRRRSSDPDLVCPALPPAWGAPFVPATPCSRAPSVAAAQRSNGAARRPRPRPRRAAALPGDDASQRQRSVIEIDEHRRFLAKYVNEVDPSVVDTFPKSVPPYVTEAMRSTVSSLTGSLPPQFFDVTISSIGDNLKSLMFSFLMTGYLFRNVQYHLELKQGQERALPSSVLFDDGYVPERAGARFGLRSEERDGYAPGAKLSGISGEVTRWHYALGVERVPASQYISLLEKEVQQLREQLKEKEEEQARDGGNELMEYLRNTSQATVHDMKVSAEVKEAMQMFLKRLLGTTDSRELAEMSSETSATELSRLLMWLLIVGYTLRNMEVRFSMEQSFSLPFVSLEDKGLTGDF